MGDCPECLEEILIDEQEERGQNRILTNRQLSQLAILRLIEIPCASH